jgi:hypothetical protein
MLLPLKKGNRCARGIHFMKVGAKDCAAYNVPGKFAQCPAQCPAGHPLKVKGRECWRCLHSADAAKQNRCLKDRHFMKLGAKERVRCNAEAAKSAAASVGFKGFVFIYENGISAPSETFPNSYLEGMLRLQSSRMDQG